MEQLFTQENLSQATIKVKSNGASSVPHIILFLIDNGSIPLQPNPIYSVEEHRRLFNHHPPAEILFQQPPTSTFPNHLIRTAPRTTFQLLRENVNQKMVAAIKKKAGSRLSSIVIPQKITSSFFFKRHGLHPRTTADPPEQINLQAFQRPQNVRQFSLHSGNKVAAGSLLEWNKTWAYQQRKRKK